MNGRDILTRYLERTEFTSYEDFKANYRLKVPANFNFAFDVVDAFAREEPERFAVIGTLDHTPDETAAEVWDIVERRFPAPAP